MKLNSSQFHLDVDRLLQDLADFGAISKTRSGGVNRIAFSDADREGRNWVKTHMQELGMTPRTDPAGNDIGVYPGSEAGLKPIALGSHTDSVPDGGQFDGALGVLSSLACVRAIREAGMHLRHPIEVINFSAEEGTVAGGTFGSRAMAGLLDPHVLEQCFWGDKTVTNYLTEAGLEPDSITQAARSEGDLVAYLELHIEQGRTLESAAKTIGIVEGIVGIRRYEVVFEGHANHAGTTAMQDRDDALIKAAPYVQTVRDAAISQNIVGTVGTLQVQPGAPNVIPQRVALSVETRGLEEAKLDVVEDELRTSAGDSGASFERISYKPPVSSAPDLLTALESSCEEAQVPYLYMPSGAGHDAMCMAAITRQAMLFVPSREGVSHSPEEYTDPDSCASGARVLLGALLELDSELDGNRR